MLGLIGHSGAPGASGQHGVWIPVFTGMTVCAVRPSTLRQAQGGLAQEERGGEPVRA